MGQSIVNDRGFNTPKGLIKGYERVKVRVQFLRPLLNPYPLLRAWVYPWPNLCDSNEPKIIQIGLEIKEICLKQCLDHIFFNSGLI
jgi:hypothetical protein